MLWQMGDRALHRHFVGNGRRCSRFGRQSHSLWHFLADCGVGGLDRRAGSREFRVGLTRIQPDSHGESAHDLVECPVTLSGGIGEALCQSRCQLDNLRDQEWRL
jgi:hypothetical protein